MTLRGFSVAGVAADARRIGDEIFSKVKTGMVDPRRWKLNALGAALEFHPKNPFEQSMTNKRRHETFTPV